MTTPAQDAPLVFPSVAFNPSRLLLVCAAITAVVVAAAGFSGHLMVGVFFGVGLLLGLLNALLVRRSVASITAKEHPMKSSMALNSAARLAIITVIGLIIAYIFRPAGLGVVFGLALFQVVLVLSTALPVWKKLRAGDWSESASEGTERGNTSDE
ncbi:ATP synthase subunit I [Mycobacterium sp. Aquia_213]|uniref:ATP synthase subunit I n=1 Tax=Mycobacterium sp. Aquia_213 TaxID=2991728 RepID=UPI00226D99A9|nr:ATP synthase subunit I [Mycobacterium sp. Aquia_213]WAC92972.1 ATP synthase subunit I [Mycobacterium sp. Aquia_213]